MDHRDIIGLYGARYLRKSREDQVAEARGEGETLSKHRKILDEIVVKYKLKITDSFEEIESGESIDYRPEMVELLKKVDAKKYSFVLCMDLDRLGRGGLIDQGVIQKAFKDSKTIIITPRKIYDLNDEMDEEWTEFEGFMARRELKTITRRMQRGRIQSARDGKFMGSHMPYGYDKNDDLKLIPNENAKYVKMIFDWYVNGDINGDYLGGTKIAKKLNEMGIKTPRGKSDWDNTTILAILKNEVYLGKIQWKKSVKSKKEHFNHQTDKSTWIETLNAHEAIIDEKIFNQAKKIRSEKLNPSHNLKKIIRNPLVGLIICSKCDKKMVMQGNTGTVKKRIYMIKCITSNCETKSSSLDYVEKEMWNELDKYLEQLKIEEEKINTENKESKENPYLIPIENLKKEIKELEVQEDKLDDLLEKGLYDVEKYKKRSAILVETLKEKRLSLDNLVGENDIFINKKEIVQKQIKLITDIKEMYFKVKDIDVKNKLLKSVVNFAIYKREPDSPYKKGLKLDISTHQI